MMNLAHALAVRSDFSIGQSMLQIDHIVETAKAMGLESVALADIMSIHGMIDFSNKMGKAGLKPIIGCTVRVVRDPTYRKPSKASGEKEAPNPMYQIKVYPTSEAGMKSLIKLLSKGNAPDYFYYVSRVGLEDVLALEDVVVTTGDLFNVFHVEDHRRIVGELAKRFPTYVELTPINTPLFDTLNLKAALTADALSLSTLVTYPVFYRQAEDAPTLDVLSVIASQEKMDSRWRPVQFVTDFAFQDDKSLVTKVKAAATRMLTRCKQDGIDPTPFPKLWMAGLNNIEAFAKRNYYAFKNQPVCLPVMSDNDFALLCAKVREGFKKRLLRPVLGYQPTDLKPYVERVEYELRTLNRLGFCNYFLLVEDLVNWAKANGVIVGPGRGSVGGSLVAYLIGMTEVDPIRFHLIFERFINPERQDLPDADLDFASSVRHKVIEYLRDTYGADRVAGISNYATLASASALRDTGRVFGLSGLDMTATKLVPKEGGTSFSLTEAAKAVPELERFKSEFPTIWSHATKLEGVMRSFGTHAAGVVVAGEPLTERAVVETRGESPVTNWDKRVVEDMGLVKMDILGLSTLDVLDIAKRMIKERHGIEVDYLTLPLEDPDIMDAFGRGETTGVFQFESSGMKKLLRDIAQGGRLTFEDITAATALYRPGPMDSGMLDEFVRIRQGHRAPHYDHPNMIGALETTYGVMIYQEQVMRVSQDVAGYTLAEADKLRKAMGKKDATLMASMREKFVYGATKGEIEVTLENGTVKRVHRAAKFAVSESDEKFTVEEIMAKGYTLLSGL
jgi:DNA polymerase-3 subunit alpha